MLVKNWGLQKNMAKRVSSPRLPRAAKLITINSDVAELNGNRLSPLNVTIVNISSKDMMLSARLFFLIVYSRGN